MEDQHSVQQTTSPATSHLNSHVALSIETAETFSSTKRPTSAAKRAKPPSSGTPVKMKSVGAKEETSPNERVGVLALSMSSSVSKQAVHVGARPAYRTPRLLKHIRQQAAKQSTADAFVVRCKRKVRSGSSLDSGEVGDLQVGAIVRIVEHVELPDGTKRVLVQLIDEDQPHGWISRLGSKDDRDALDAFHWMRFQRDRAAERAKVREAAEMATAIAAARIDAEIKARQQHAASPANGKKTDGSSPMRRKSGILPNSAAAVAAAALQSQRGISNPVPGAIVLTPSSRNPASGASPNARPGVPQKPQAVGDSGVSKDPASSSAPIQDAGLAGSAPKASTKAMSHVVSFAAKMKGRAKSAAKGESSASSEPKRPESAMIPYEEIMAAATKLRQAAEAEDAKAEGGKSLAVQLGEVLQERCAKAADKTTFINDIIREWDPNRDGTITKMEFRSNVRKILPEVKDVKAIDSLYDELDKDHSGELDTAEVKVALKKLQQSAEKAGSRCAEARARAQAFREKADRIQQVADVTQQLEAAAKQMKELQRAAIAAKVGQSIVKKGLDIPDLVARWGGDDGTIHKGAFLKEVKSMLGAEAVTEIVDELFDSLDADGGGSLDKEELRDALKMMTESSAVRGDLKKHSQHLAELTKAAKAAQVEWKREKEEEEQEMNRKRETAAQEEAERAAEAAKAKAAKAALAAEKAAEAAAEQERFQAKVAAKRASTSK